MRIFNVGIREVILLLVIMLVLFGPRQMQENARKMAQGIRRFVRSDTWRTFLGLYDDVNNIKDQVIRESGIRDVQDSLRGVNRQLYDLDRELQQNSRMTLENPAGSGNETAGNSPDTNEQHESESD